MKALGYLVAASVMLAIAQAVVAALTLLIMLAFVISAAKQPRETFGLLIFVTIAQVAQAKPTAFIIALCVIAICSAITTAAHRRT